MWIHSGQIEHKRDWRSWFAVSRNERDVMFTCIMCSALGHPYYSLVTLRDWLIIISCFTRHRKLPELSEWTELESELLLSHFTLLHPSQRDQFLQVFWSVMKDSLSPPVYHRWKVVSWAIQESSCFILRITFIQYSFLSISFSSVFPGVCLHLKKLV